MGGGDPVTQPVLDLHLSLMKIACVCGADCGMAARGELGTTTHLDAWYDAFQPQPGDALFLAPDQRVRIW